MDTKKKNYIHMDGKKANYINNRKLNLCCKYYCNETTYAS